MPEWSDMGHAMRRRIGAPSNSLEAAGPTNGRQHPTHEEHYAAATAANSSRVALGEGPIDTPHEVMSDEQAAPSNLGKVKAVGSTVKPSASERNGASFNVTAHATHFMDPTVGPTTAQGRIVSNTAVQIADDIGNTLSNLGSQPRLSLNDLQWLSTRPSGPGNAAIADDIGSMFDRPGN